MDEGAGGIEQVDTVARDVELAIDEGALVDEVLFEADGGKGGG